MTRTDTFQKRFIDANQIHMNGLDILLMIPLIWGGYNGLKKGFVVELISSLLLILGCIKGVTLFYTLLPIVEHKLPALAAILPTSLALLMLFIGGLVIYFLTKLIREVVVISFLGIFDNMLGGLFGLCKVAFFISLLIYFWGCVGLSAFSSIYTDHSLLFPLLEPIVPKILQSCTSMHSLYPFKQWCQLKGDSLTKSKP
ncbi:CvpA family protein [Cardinium endosymbiont of Philonthus spinipes]|uniref:CvpA family protein n=1 Tax=Cardinium endosymbiont of Philonthus spinipes TaxID=3077941 RepID=UPI00313B8008